MRLVPAELWVRCEQCGILCGSKRLLGLHIKLAHERKETEFKFEPANNHIEEEDTPSSKWKKRKIG